MSKSNKPTLNPLLLRPQAIFEATVDFPTPPFPLAIAITCLTFGKTESDNGSWERGVELVLFFSCISSYLLS